MSKAKRQSRKSTEQRNLMLVAGLVLAVAVMAGLGLMLARPSASAGAGSYPAEISVAEAAAKRDEGAFMLDVRTPEEWAEYHMPGSTLIPLDELPDRLSEVPADQEVVVVCRSGNRSATARDILRDAGLEQVTSMAGGLSTWKAQGYETVSGQ